MTYKTMQDKLITSVAARFNESQRADIKDWINDRYAEMWYAEDWVFKHASASVPIVAGTPPTITAPTDFADAFGIWRPDGQRLTYLPMRKFFDRVTSPYTGTPSVYTVVGPTVYTDATDSSNYTMLYGKRLTLLAADNDVPAIPVEHHQLLIHGAMATGQVMMNDFTYQFSEQRWQNGLDAMRATWRSDTVGEPMQWADSAETLGLGVY